MLEKLSKVLGITPLSLPCQYTKQVYSCEVKPIMGNCSVTYPFWNYLTEVDYNTGETCVSKHLVGCC
ncbi:hypothetical protein D3C75_832060 [compost metagenome]